MKKNLKRRTKRLFSEGAQAQIPLVVTRWVIKMRNFILFSVTFSYLLPPALGDVENVEEIVSFIATCHEDGELLWNGSQHEQREQYETTWNTLNGLFCRNITWTLAAGCSFAAADIDSDIKQAWYHQNQTHDSRDHSATHRIVKSKRAARVLGTIYLSKIRRYIEDGQGWYGWHERHTNCDKGKRKVQ